MNIDWAAVLPIWCTQVFWTAVVIVTVVLACRAIVRRTVAEQMTAAVQAVGKRLDASEIYLTAAEQHTALQQDWEEKRHEDHERRQKENVQMLQRLIQHELDKRLKAATAAVVKKVEQVPEATAEKVMEKADPDSGLRRKAPGTGDSHHG